ncbi:MAG TPA: prepilin-type N-terminal cleavage/methylation domain-containing protein [Terriglobales bacterium]|nr:prepilin-type N-terminal cleavage/methylation domain-containing protein [Terriglobales bacterium]
MTSLARQRQRRSCRGFSLVEVMISMVILAVGLLAMLALFGQAVATTQWAQEDQIAKQKSREALESVYSARNDASINFNSIQNVANGGIFKDGFQQMFRAGANGVVGTTSDSATLDFVRQPGPDGLMNTGDDLVVPLSNYRRQIQITPVLNPDGTVNPDMRKISVTVQVNTPGRGIRNYTVSGYISRFQ